MPTFDVAVSCPVHDSFRVQQVAGMFDVPIREKATEQFEVELPTDADDWQIGLIVGPSGSGKSTVARHVYGRRSQESGVGSQEELQCRSPESRLLTPDSYYECSDWPTDRAVVDCFGELPLRKVAELFTAVGFGSPPSWIKPYHVLSCGERFRCDLARAFGGASCEERGSRNENLLRAPRSSPLVVFDEFTSVVDRTVAKACSAAIAKGIRRGHIPCRFVAVTCHYDVAEWLEPDWVLDMATCELRKRPTSGTEVSAVGCQVSGKSDTRHLTPDTWFRRPPIELEIHRCRVAAWELFKRHHYLSADLARQARCYLATWEGVPVTFCATLPVIASCNHRRFTQIVTLPDYQGIGIGMRVTEAVADLHRAEGLRINVTSSHPALIRHCRRSPKWKAVNVRKPRSRTRTHPLFAQYCGANGRTVVSFEYVGSWSQKSEVRSQESGVGKAATCSGRSGTKRMP